MICSVPLLAAFVSDSLCETSQQAGPSHEELGEQMHGDLHHLSTTTPAYKHTTTF